MPDAPQFEFPAQMRELAEKNVAQAKAACGQFMDAARKVQDVIRTMLPENSMTVGIKQVHEQAIGFTRQTSRLIRERAPLAPVAERCMGDRTTTTARPSVAASHPHRPPPAGRAALEVRGLASRA